MVNPSKTTGVRVLGAIDIDALRQAVLSIPEHVWQQEDDGKPNRFDALDRTQHIVFRFVESVKDWRRSYDRPIWNEWRTLIEPVLRAAVEPYGYERGCFPRIMLARMGAGGIIKPHVDAGLAAQWPHKIHIPLQTNDQVTFYIHPREYHFPEGTAVEVNNLVPHAVRNGGTSPRIHLIYEYCEDEVS